MHMEFDDQPRSSYAVHRKTDHSTSPFSRAITYGAESGSPSLTGTPSASAVSASMRNAGHSHWPAAVNDIDRTTHTIGWQRADRAAASMGQDTHRSPTMSSSVTSGHDARVLGKRSRQDSNDSRDTSLKKRHRVGQPPTTSSIGTSRASIFRRPLDLNIEVGQLASFPDLENSDDELMILGSSPAPSRNATTAKSKAPNSVSKQTLRTHAKPASFSKTQSVGCSTQASHKGKGVSRSPDQVRSGSSIRLKNQQTSHDGVIRSANRPPPAYKANQIGDTISSRQQVATSKHASKLPAEGSQSRSPLGPAGKHGKQRAPSDTGAGLKTRGPFLLDDTSDDEDTDPMVDSKATDGTSIKQEGDYLPRNGHENQLIASKRLRDEAKQKRFQPRYEDSSASKAVQAKDGKTSCDLIDTAKTSNIMPATKLVWRASAPNSVSSSPLHVVDETKQDKRSGQQSFELKIESPPAPSKASSVLLNISTSNPAGAPTQPKATTSAGFKAVLPAIIHDHKQQTSQFPGPPGAPPEYKLSIIGDSTAQDVAELPATKVEEAITVTGVTFQEKDKRMFTIKPDPSSMSNKVSRSLDACDFSAENPQDNCTSPSRPDSTIETSSDIITTPDIGENAGSNQAVTQAPDACDDKMYDQHIEHAHPRAVPPPKPEEVSSSLLRSSMADDLPRTRRIKEMKARNERNRIADMMTEAESQPLATPPAQYGGLFSLNSVAGIEAINLMPNCPREAAKSLEYRPQSPSLPPAGNLLQPDSVPLDDTSSALKASTAPPYVAHPDGHSTSNLFPPTADDESTGIKKSNRTSGRRGSHRRRLGRITVEDLLLIKWKDDDGIDIQEIVERYMALTDKSKKPKTLMERRSRVRNALTAHNVTRQMRLRATDGDVDALEELNRILQEGMEGTTIARHNANDSRRPALPEPRIDMQPRDRKDPTASSTPLSLSTPSVLSPPESTSIKQEAGERPTMGGKQPCWAMMFGPEVEHADDDSEDDREPSPTTSEDYCHFAYQIERRCCTTEQHALDGTVIDELPWSAVGDALDNLLEANKLAGVFILATEPGHAPIIDPYKTYGYTSSPQGNNEAFLEVNSDLGTAQVRVRRFMRDYREHVLPSSKEDWHSRIGFCVKIRITTEEKGDGMFEIGSRSIVEELADRRIFTSLQMANLRAIDQWVSETFTSGTCQLDLRDVEIHETKQALIERLGEDCEEDVFSMKGMVGDRTIEIWVDELQICGPRN